MWGKRCYTVRAKIQWTPTSQLSVLFPPKVPTALHRVMKEGTAAGGSPAQRPCLYSHSSNSVEVELKQAASSQHTHLSHCFQGAFYLLEQFSLRRQLLDSLAGLCKRRPPPPKQLWQGAWPQGKGDEMARLGWYRAFCAQKVNPNKWHCQVDN